MFKKKLLLNAVVAFKIEMIFSFEIQISVSGNFLNYGASQIVAATSGRRGHLPRLSLGRCPLRPKSGAIILDAA